MDEEVSSDVPKTLTDGNMDTDEGPLINENSNGLSHLLTEGEFSSVDAVGVDESSASNQGFLNALSSGDYLSNNTGFDAEFDVGDNAVNFPSDSLNNVLSDNDSRISDTAEYKLSSVVEDITESQPSQMDGVSHVITEHNEQEPVLEQDSKLTADNDNDSKLSIEAECKDSKLTADNDNDSKLSIGAECKDPKLTADNDNDSKLSMEAECVMDNVKDNDITEPVVSNNVVDITGTEEENTSNCAIDTTEAGQKVAHDDGVEIVAQDSEVSEVRGAEETEVVSEDELPTVEKPSIKDAENVSDDELPGPKPAELPADTEVVSEDELPSAKKETKDTRKRKMDDEKNKMEAGSPTSESKKQAVAKDGESKPVPSEKRLSTDEKPKKKLPELDKYWKVVNDDPTDFTGWTYLLQYVDQESDVEAAREAYDAFLSHYPYCYGYWRKYADYEKRKGSKKKCLEVLERGLKSIPLSVDLWIHYLNHVKSTRADDHAHVRSQYERAIESCGLEFRSDRLWESYIKWETEHGSPQQVTALYDRLLATPTLGYTTHFDNFQEHIMSEPVSALVPKTELVRLRAEVRESGVATPQLDLPPGEDEPPEHIASEEEGQAIKERIIAIRRKIHKSTGEEVAARWSFEEGIKRPYFHVKPLERCQLKNWKTYLEWEQQNGSLQRALVLHERCLIACALYHEFWMRLVKFLEEKTESNPELVSVEREVLERACTVHHLDKPELHLHWAHFEEAQGNPAKAAEILDRIEKTCPNVVQIQYRRVNLERRRGDLDKCAQLYEGYIAAAKNKAIASALAIKYARFLQHLRNDSTAARKVLDDAITRDPLNQRLHLQRLDLALNTPGVQYPELEELVCSYEKQPGAELEAKASMAWRWRELAEELGDAAASKRATAHAHSLAKHLRKRARKEKHEAQPTSNSTTTETKKKEAAPPSHAPTGSNAYYGQTGPAPAQYDTSYQPPYQPPWPQYQQPAPPYHQPPWPAQYPNYY